MIFNKAIIFDLDGTLYESKEIDKENILASIYSISEFYNVSLEDSKELLEKSRKNDKTQEINSISKTLKKLEIPIDVIEKNQSLFITPENHIELNLTLIKLIKKLRNNYKIAILTNTRTNIANRILYCLGFSLNDFDLILTGDLISEPKPSLSVIENCLKKLNCNPNNSIMVGDRWNVDLEPAEKIGMKTKLIKNNLDLIKWLKDKNNEA